MPLERRSRIDPNNRMGVDFHAARAFQTRFETLPPDQRRAAMESATFRNKEPHKGESALFKRAVLAILDQLEGRLTPEQTELLLALGSQIEPALAVWQGKEGLDTKGAPSKDGIQHWIDALSPQALDGILEYREPRLVVVPPELTIELLKRIGGHDYYPKGWDKVQAPGWKFGITDGVEDMEFDPSIFYVNPDASEDERTPRTNEQMVLEYARRFQAIKGQDLMPQNAYVPAAATVMAGGKVLDRANYTAFKKPKGASYLPGAGWGGDRVGLGGYDPEGSNQYLRCRPWVEGEMSA